MTYTINGNAKLQVVPKIEKPGTAEIIPPSLVSDIAHKVENTKSADIAFANVLKLQSDTIWKTFELGGFYSVILRNKWFGEFPSFETLCETKFNENPRRSRYFAEIYDWAVESKFSPEEINEVGWTKLRLLTKIPPEEANEWLIKAKASTVKNLGNLLKAAKNFTDANEGVCKVSFQLHADQQGTVMDALEKCKQQTETPHDNAALEYICMEYLGGQLGQKKLSAETPDEAAISWMKATAPDRIIELFCKAYPGWKVDVKASGC